MNAKDMMIERAVKQETYAQAKDANWPRPTCQSCHAPCAYDREFRATGTCQACYRDLAPLTTKPKGVSHAH